MMIRNGGVALGAIAGVGVGLCNGIRDNVLVVSGIAGFVAGGIVVFGIESVAEVAIGAILATGAATTAAVTAGICIAIFDGVIARRNWPY
jgi:hypothetical protein